MRHYKVLKSYELRCFLSPQGLSKIDALVGLVTNMR